ncbi:hypothetical protein [Burkholderia gladioli]|uniref:hypothetical protein n=1 Tax=Burkholderia gladioli TaxID=28095 RepID=UPI001642086C|nr:hypothetical protein [Burkholderia gladioli]
MENSPTKACRKPFPELARNAHIPRQARQIARTQIIFSKYINTFHQRLNFNPQTKSVVHSGLPAAISKIIQEIDNHTAINRSSAIKHHHRPGKFNCPMENLIASRKSVNDGMPRID